MPYAPINGINLYYETHGKGPALVFAHGAGGNHLSWWQQIPVFAERYRCIVFDHRAFGLSKDEPSEEAPGRRMFHEDLRALLEHLEVDEVRIVAQSMGGRSAVGFIWRNPGRCKALVLAGTTGGAVNDEVRELQDAHRETDIGRMTLAKRSVAADLKLRDPQREFLYRSIGRLNPPRPRDFLAPPPASYRGSSAELLARAGFPVLFLVGRHDTVTPPEIIEGCHRGVPGSQFIVIEDSGHSTYFEQPQAFNDAVLRFLDATL